MIGLRRVESHGVKPRAGYRDEAPLASENREIPCRHRSWGTLPACQSNEARWQRAPRTRYPALHGLAKAHTLPFCALPMPALRAGDGRRMHYDPANPLIVQGDRTVLLEVDNPRYAEARDSLAPFAELEKSPEHIHTYRLTPLSLWNAAAAGHNADAMIDVLRRYSKFPLPTNIAADLADIVSRFGRVKLERTGVIGPDGVPELRLVCADRPLL